jgi:glutamate racemase
MSVELNDITLKLTCRTPLVEVELFLYPAIKLACLGHWAAKKAKNYQSRYTVYLACTHFCTRVDAMAREQARSTQFVTQGAVTLKIYEVSGVRAP